MMRKKNIRVSVFVVFCLCFVSSLVLLPARDPSNAHSLSAKASKIETPEIFCGGSTPTSININVCAPSGAGATGLPAGFSLHWMTATDFAANGSNWYDSEDPRLWKASFSGNAESSRYRLSPGSCVTVNVGDFIFDNGFSTNCTDGLHCGTSYVFRAFGHATNTLNRSSFTDNLTCGTSDCPQQGCTLRAIEWIPQFAECDPGGDGVARSLTEPFYPPNSRMVGTVTYDGVLCMVPPVPSCGSQLVCILGEPTNGNGLVALAQQLIAAKLNVMKNGGAQQSVLDCIANADAIIGGLVVPPVGTDFLDPSVTAAATTCLLDYNEGRSGTPSCTPPDPGGDHFNVKLPFLKQGK